MRTGILQSIQALGHLNGYLYKNIMKKIVLYLQLACISGVTCAADIDNPREHVRSCIAANLNIAALTNMVLSYIPKGEWLLTAIYRAHPGEHDTVLEDDENLQQFLAKNPVEKYIMLNGFPQLVHRRSELGDLEDNVAFPYIITSSEHTCPHAPNIPHENVIPGQNIQYLRFENQCVHPPGPKDNSKRGLLLAHKYCYPRIRIKNDTQEIQNKDQSVFGDIVPSSKGIVVEYQSSDGKSSLAIFNFACSKCAQCGTYVDTSQLVQLPLPELFIVHDSVAQDRVRRLIESDATIGEKSFPKVDSPLKVSMSTGLARHSSDFRATLADNNVFKGPIINTGSKEKLASVISATRSKRDPSTLTLDQKRQQANKNLRNALLSIPLVIAPVALAMKVMS